jgi:hypothetical protein
MTAMTSDDLGDEALARLVRRKVKALGKIADAIEGALAVPSES